MENGLCFTDHIHIANAHMLSLMMLSISRSTVWIVIVRRFDHEDLCQVHSKLISVRISNEVLDLDNLGELNWVGSGW